MATCGMCANLKAFCRCGVHGDGAASVVTINGTTQRHPIYDALDAHIDRDTLTIGSNAATYYLASQIAELMQRIEKLERNQGG